MKWGDITKEHNLKKARVIQRMNPSGTVRHEGIILCNKAYTTLSTKKGWLYFTDDDVVEFLDNLPPKKVPLIWNFDYAGVIGHATIQEDGTAVVTVTDPDLVARIKKDREDTPIAFNTGFSPATPKSHDDDLDARIHASVKRVLKQVFEEMFDD